MSDTSSIGEDVELLEDSYITGENVKLHSHLENNLPISLKVTHIPIIWSSNSIYVHKNTYARGIQHFFHNKQNMDQPKCSSTG